MQHMAKFPNSKFTQIINKNKEKINIIHLQYLVPHLAYLPTFLEKKSNT